MLMCTFWFHAVFTWQLSGRRLLCKDGMKPVVTNKPPCYQMYISKDELICDVLLWTPTYGCAKAGQPARTYIQQLCEDTGCNSEDLPEAMNDREKWRERVRDIRAGGATWWWWCYIHTHTSEKLYAFYEKSL